MLGEFHTVTWKLSYYGKKEELTCIVLQNCIIDSWSPLDGREATIDES